MNGISKWVAALLLLSGVAHSHSVNKDWEDAFRSSVSCKQQPQTDSRSCNEEETITCCID